MIKNKSLIIGICIVFIFGSCSEVFYERGQSIKPPTVLYGYRNFNSKIQSQKEHKLIEEISNSNTTVELHEKALENDTFNSINTYKFPVNSAVYLSKSSGIESKHHLLPKLKDSKSVFRKQFKRLGLEIKQARVEPQRNTNKTSTISNDNGERNPILVVLGILGLIVTFIHLLFLLFFGLFFIAYGGLEGLLFLGILLVLFLIELGASLWLVSRPTLEDGGILKVLAMAFVALSVLLTFWSFIELILL